MIELYDEVAPNFKASILHRDVVGPYEMEQEYGLIGGNIFHGELSLEQLFHMRPAPGYADYRTPISGLYYGSSATHAGGGVCGIPGWQAARAALADRKVGKSGARAQRPRSVTTNEQLDFQARKHCAAASGHSGPRPALQAMLEARSVAIVGASARPDSFGARMLAEVRRSAVEPVIYPVNPRYARDRRPRCYPSLADLPEPGRPGAARRPRRRSGAAAGTRRRNGLPLGA